MEIEESRGEAQDGHAMQIDGVEDRVQVDIELSRGEETDPGQTKWYRAGSTVNIKESDKLAVLTDCGAQDMTISGGRVVQWYRTWRGWRSHQLMSSRSTAQSQVILGRWAG